MVKLEDDEMLGCSGAGNGLAVGA